MSSKKRPLRDITLPEQQAPPRTPRYAPSTPHAVRALQQRSGAGQRSTRVNKYRADVAERPESARGILRRFAKITAPTTRRRVSTPVGKENVPASSSAKKSLSLGVEDDPLSDEEDIERPDFSLPVVEEDDSELVEAPTPSALPGGEYHDPTITFQDVATAASTRQSMSARPERRTSRLSKVSRNDDDDDEDREVEIGRRAVSEDPTHRYPRRSSFGSLRMSGFQMEDLKRVSGYAREITPRLDLGNDYDYDVGNGMGDDFEIQQDNETEDFRRHRRSLSLRNEIDEQTDDAPQEHDETFRLELPEQHREHDAQSQVSDEEGEDFLEGRDDEHNSPGLESPQRKSRPITPIEAAAMAQAPRRKKLKLTKHGIAIPALPSSLVKRLAVESMTRRGKRKPTIDRASLKALEQATEWFFEQVGEDLEAFSAHAGRKKRIDTSDVLTLMKRQRVLSGRNALREHAREYLPPEALRELDLPKEL